MIYRLTQIQKPNSVSLQVIIHGELEEHVGVMALLGLHHLQNTNITHLEQIEYRIKIMYSTFIPIHHKRSLM